MEVIFADHKSQLSEGRRCDARKYDDRGVLQPHSRMNDSDTEQKSESNAHRQEESYQHVSIPEVVLTLPPQGSLCVEQPEVQPILDSTSQGELLERVDRFWEPAFRKDNVILEYGNEWCCGLCDALLEHVCVVSRL